jgi:hypothetical protein
MKTIEENTGVQTSTRRVGRVTRETVVSVESVKFAGVDYPLAGFAKLESDWTAAKGRITALVSKVGEAALGLDVMARRKADVRAVENVTLETVIVNRPEQVATVAARLVKNHGLSSKDAATWVSYVGLVTALKVARQFGKL